VTLEELENTLPNGLHDAEVQRVSVDYKQRKLVLDLVVWVGNMADPPERREAYKTGSVEISGLIFFVVEPPDAKSPFRDSAKLTVDGCDMSKNLSRELLASLPSDAFFRSLWVNEWNAFIHIAARNAAIAWVDGSGVTYR
jgi:hypothetical protein